MFGSKLSKAKDVLSSDGDELLDALGLVRKSEQASWLWPALGGLCLGAACGIAVGMLLAPKKGSELREELADRFGGQEPARGFAPPPVTSGRSGTAI